MNPFRIIIYLALLGLLFYAANEEKVRLAAIAVIGIFVLWILAWIVKHYGNK